MNIIKQTATIKTQRKRSFFEKIFSDRIDGEKLLPPHVMEARYKAAMKIVKMQTIIVAILVGLIVVVAPFLRTQSNYYAQSETTRERTPLSFLYLPNLTKQAVLSWAATTVTEVMTFSFADFNEKIAAQKNKFLPDSWNSFVEALYRDGFLTRIEQQQLVVTTAPAGAPVIISEGVVGDRYEWRIQMPIITTFITTNNRSSQQKSIVELTIVRVSTLDSPSGIAIKQWTTY